MTERLDFQPAVRPGDVRLKGRYGSVVRLDPPSHGEAIWNAVKEHVGLWTYLPYGPFPSEEMFAGWLAERRRIERPLCLRDP